MKAKKYLLILLSMLLILANTVVFAADSTEENDDDLTPEEMNLKEGTEFGRAAGKIDGAGDALAHFYEGFHTQYYMGLPSTTTLIEKYNLKDDDVFYKLNFIEAYKIAYQKAYNTAYREASIASVQKPYEKAIEQGKSAGNSAGYMVALEDYVQKKYSDWESAYNAYVADGTLSARYFLDSENQDYRYLFKAGFEQAFMESYTEQYQQNGLDEAIRSHNMKYVTLREETLNFDDEYTHFIAGEAEAETRTPAVLYLPAGAVRTSTYLGLYKLQNSPHKSQVLESVSSKFIVSIGNEAGEIELQKPLTLTFEYFGSEKAGIYKWNRNRWEYQYTTLTDGKMSTEIPMGTYEGGEYAIFVDETYKNILDIRFNWAFKEIFTLMRRGGVEDQVNFYPETGITKGELAKMIYSIEGTESSTESMIYMRDTADINTDKQAYNYVVQRAYMSLDSVLNFNPDQKISYRQFEIVMSSVLKRDFKWSEVSDSMISEKFRKSNGTTNINAQILKSECAYALIKLLQ